MSRPVEDKIYLLVRKTWKKSVLLSTVQYALCNGDEHYDVSNAFLRTEMVKVVIGASSIMHKAGDTAKTLFPSLKSSGFRCDVE